MKSFRRNLKAISPIFATLILIAIAVIAGVVVYMFTSGTLQNMTTGGSTGSEKLQIQTAQFTETGTGATATQKVTLYCKVLAGGNIPIESVQLKDSSGAIKQVITGFVVTDYQLASSLGGTAVNPAGAYFPGSGVLTVLTVDLPSNILASASGTYTVTLSTNAGGVFSSPSFQAIATATA